MNIPMTSPMFRAGEAGTKPHKTSQLHLVHPATHAAPGVHGIRHGHPLLLVTDGFNRWKRCEKSWDFMGYIGNILGIYWD